MQTQDFIVVRRNPAVDPAFRLNARMRFPLDGELDFYFENLIFIRLKKNDLESPLIFVLL